MTSILDDFENFNELIRFKKNAIFHIVKQKNYFRSL